MEWMEGYNTDHDLITCKGKVFNPAAYTVGLRPAKQTKKFCNVIG